MDKSLKNLHGIFQQPNVGRKSVVKADGAAEMVELMALIRETILARFNTNGCFFWTFVLGGKQKKNEIRTYSMELMM